MRARLGGPVHPLSPGARGQHCQGPAGPAPGLNLPKTPSRPHCLLGAPAEGNTGRLQLAALAGGGRRGGRKRPLASPQGAGPWGSPGPLTQEGDAGMSRQLLAASLGEDVGALLGHRDTGSTCFLSAGVWGGRGGGHARDRPGLTEQWGQTKPLMFSTSPITRSPTFLQKVSSRLTSPTDTAWRPGKGQGGRWVPRKQPRWERRAGRLREQYLGRGDHKGPQGTVGAQGIHHGHVLVRGPWGRVHNQVVQLPPGHIGHKLLYQRCGDPGRLRVGGSGQAGRVSPGPHPLLAPERGDLWVLGPLAFGELCVPLRARGETLPQPPRTSARALASMAGVGTLQGQMSVPQRGGLQGMPGGHGLGAAPAPDLLPHLAAPRWPSEGAEPCLLGQRHQTSGEDQAAKGLMAAAHTLAPQARCLHTRRLQGSGSGGASWK